MFAVQQARPRARVSSGVVLAMLLVFFAAALPASSAAPRAATVVRVEPSIVKAPVGGTFTVKIYVADVAGMNAADARLAFDPQVLEVVDADPAMAGVQIAPLTAFMLPDYVARNVECGGDDPANPDCSGGKGLIWYAATQVYPHPPVSGSGAIAAITFRRIKEGDAALTWKYIKVVDKDGRQIPTEGQDGLALTGAAPRRIFLPLLMR